LGRVFDNSNRLNNNLLNLFVAFYDKQQQNRTTRNQLPKLTFAGGLGLRLIYYGFF